MVMRYLDLPPVWTLASCGLSWLLAEVLPFGRFEAPLLSALLFWGGLALILWSALWFFLKKTPVEPRQTPKVLITEGPYRINRNPIYTGLILIAAGVGLGQGAAAALLPALALPAILTQRFVLPEEAVLRETFGAEAEDWLARSRRWIW